MAETTDLLIFDSDGDTSEDDEDTDDESTPTSRFWHFSQLVESNVYIGGGNIQKFKSKKGRAHLARTIEQFNVEERTWRQLETTGDHHPGLTGVACASFGKYLFAYGGNSSERLNGALSQLDLETLTWSQLSPETADGPMRKDASGMAHFGEDNLAVVCGYAEPRDPTKYNGGSSDHGSRFIERPGPSAEGGGWTNEMHIFNRKLKDSHSGTWTSPSFSGPRPPPCADFSLTSIDIYRAILYGGRRGIDENSNDLYLIDFDNKAIMKLQPTEYKQEDKWPKIRMGHHAACCLGFNTENAQLLISGGRLKQKLPPKDIWILNLATSTWKEVKLPNDDIQNQLGRWGHTFTAVTHSEGLVEVIMFGGCPGLYEVSWEVYRRKDFNRLSFPVSFILGLLDKEWVLLDVVDCGNHWTSKTTKLMSFDPGSPPMLDVLYSMEQDKIPVLTELIDSQKIRSTICSENTEALYKWPTFTEPSLYEPTWGKLCLILELANMNDLAEMIKQYLEKQKDTVLSRREICTGVQTSREDHHTVLCIPGQRQPDLQGVEVLQKATVTVTNSKHTFVWEGYGLKLHIPENSLPSDVKQVTLTIMASIAGHYQFPKNSSPISGVYWFCYEPTLNCKLEKPVILEIQHCAKLSENASNLSFVRSSSNQDKLPYTFKHLEGGQFTSHSSYGNLKVNKFCGIAVIGPPKAKGYIASLFYLRHETVCWDIRFVMTLDTELHRKASEKEFSKRADSEINVDFESDEITLDIPLDGTKVLEGWKLYPNTYPMVTKGMVDNFVPGRRIPHCQMFADLVEPSRARERHLCHRVSLQGAKAPSNFVNIILSPEASTPVSSANPDDVAGQSSDISKPNTKNLTIFKWKNKDGEVKKFRLKSHIFHKWRDIGNLVASYEQLEVWAREKDANGCCDAVLNHWLNHPPSDYPPTWEGLIELLDDIELHNVAAELKTALENAV